jgi:hypothetical protein
LSLAGCASKATPPQTPQQKFEALQDNRSTDEEVRIVWGIPDASLTQGQHKTWIYRNKNDSKKQVYQLPQGFEGRGVILVFDAAGILKEHRQVDAEQLKAAQAATPISAAEPAAPEAPTTIETDIP